MIKKLELSREDSCLSRARPDERLFILLERDIAAPATIRFWTDQRIRMGKNKLSDPQIQEALQCAEDMKQTQSESLSVECALTLIAEKARFQIARATDSEVVKSLVEIADHCKSAMKKIRSAKIDEISKLPCAMGCGGGKHAKDCSYNAAMLEEKECQK